MRSIIYLIFASVFLSLIVISCSENEPNVPPPVVDDTNNGFQSKAVAEIFANNCATSGCHTGSSPAGGLSVVKFSDLIKGSTNRSGGTIPNYGGEDIIPFRLQESLLYQMIEGNVTPSAPHDVVALSQAEKDTIKSWIENGARDYNGNVPFSNPTYRVFVCDQGSDKISVIDGDTKVVSAIIDVDTNPQGTDSPHMVKYKDGFLYVTLIGTGRFLKIRASDYEIVDEATGIEKAGMIQILPDGSKAYVSRSSTSSPIYTEIYVVDLSTMNATPIALDWLGGVPHAMALTPDGSKLYVANLTLDRVGIIDTETDEWVGDIPLTPGTQPMEATMSPDGNYLYVSAHGLAKLMVIDTQIDTVIFEAAVSEMPMHIAISSDGHKIYVGSMMNNVVDVVHHHDLHWEKEKEISHPGFRMLHGCDITADNKYVYVSSRNTDVTNYFEPHFKVEGEDPPGTLGIIDTQTDEVVKLLEIEEFGSGLVVEK